MGDSATKQNPLPKGRGPCTKRDRCRYFQYFPEQYLALASQVPPSFWHCSLVSPPAKAGTVKARTRVRANIDTKVFMTLSPLCLREAPVGGVPGLRVPLWGTVIWRITQSIWDQCSNKTNCNF